MSHYKATVIIEKITHENTVEDQYGREKSHTPREKVVVSELKVSATLINSLKKRLTSHIDLVQDVDFTGDNE